MEDCPQNTFHNYVEFSLRLLGGVGNSLVIPVQDISLPARTRSKYCKSGSFDPHFGCLSDFHEDIHGNHQEHHYFRKS